MLYKFLTVLVLSSFEIYAAIPAGFAFGLTPWEILLASIIGGLSGVFIIAFLGEKIKLQIDKYRKPQAPKKPHAMAHKIWNKYGVIGLGLLGTLTIGAPISIAVGVSFNAKLHLLITWCCIGVILRCVIFTLIGHYGIKLF